MRAEKMNRDHWERHAKVHAGPSLSISVLVYPCFPLSCRLTLRDGAISDGCGLSRGSGRTPFPRN